MRLFNASHLEIKKYFSEDFQTNPYEAGWASECIFFIHVEDIKDVTSEPVLTAHVQISHDGVHWCDEGTVSENFGTEGLHFLRVREFGNWLRLDVHVSGASFKLNIQIACKE
jgi:hypothetical protein